MNLSDLGKLVTHGAYVTWKALLGTLITMTVIWGGLVTYSLAQHSDAADKLRAQHSAAPHAQAIPRQEYEGDMTAVQDTLVQHRQDMKEIRTEVLDALAAIRQAVE